MEEFDRMQRMTGPTANYLNPSAKEHTAVEAAIRPANDEETKLAKILSKPENNKIQPVNQLDIFQELVEKPASSPRLLWMEEKMYSELGPSEKWPVIKSPVLAGYPLYDLSRKQKKQLTRDLTCQCVKNGFQTTKAEIKEMENGFEKAYLSQRIDWLDSYQKRGPHYQNDLREDSAIYDLQLDVCEMIESLKGFPNGNPSIPKQEGEFYYNSIKVLVDLEPKNPIKANTGQASTMSDAWVEKSHYGLKVETFIDAVIFNEKAAKPDNFLKADISNRYAGKPEGAWYGPVHEFKVLAVQTSERAGDPLWKCHGSRIILEILGGSEKEDENTVELIHFTSIYLPILQGIDKTFAAGTFLGMTLRNIGQTSGPHLHMAAVKKVGGKWVQNPIIHRERLYTLWTGRATDKKAENARDVEFTDDLNRWLNE